MRGKEVRQSAARTFKFWEICKVEGRVRHLPSRKGKRKLGDLEKTKGEKE